MKKASSILTVFVMVSAMLVCTAFVYMTRVLAVSHDAVKLTNADGCGVVIGADSDYVYFAEYFGPLYDGSIRKVRLNLPLGQYPVESESLAVGGDPWSVAIDAEYVYYTVCGDLGPGRIMRVAKGGGDPEVLAYTAAIGGCYHPWGLAVDPSCVDPYVYFTVRDGPGGWSDPNGYVGKVQKTGGPIFNLTAMGQIKYPNGLAIDSDFVYFVQRDAGIISRVSKDGGVLVTLTTGLQRMYCMLAVDSDWVYFGEAVQNGRVGKVAKNGNGTVVFLATNQYFVVDVAVDQNFVYFTQGDATPGGNIKRVPKNGGEVETLVSDVYWPQGILLTNTGQTFFIERTNPGSPNIGGVYIVRSHVIPASINIDPDSLNLRSSGNWITSYIQLQQGYNVADINVSTMMLNDTVPAALKPTAVGDYNNDGIPDLMVKFDRQATVDLILRNCDLTGMFGTATLTVTGTLNDGTLFMGSDTIKIVMPMPKGAPKGTFDR
jgi:sugar lactone lactonase YvrE